MKEREIWGGALCLRVQHKKIAGGEGIQALESAPGDVISMDGHELKDQRGKPQLHPA